MTAWEPICKGRFIVFEVSRKEFQGKTLSLVHVDRTVNTFGTRQPSHYTRNFSGRRDLDTYTHRYYRLRNRDWKQLT